MKRSSLALTAFTITVIALVVSPSASATVQHKETYTSCIESSNPEVACFGGDVMNNPPDPNDPNYGCLVDYQSCYRQCIADEQAAHDRCNQIADPVDQANCYATADTTASACTDDCSYTTLHACQ